MFRSCFICEKSIKTAAGYKDNDPQHNPFIHEFNDPTDDATCWTTKGNYGTIIYDALFEDKMLEITICDECLKNGIENGLVNEVKFKKGYEYDVKLYKLGGQ